MTNNKDLKQKLNELEVLAMDEYMKCNNIEAKDFLNPEVMGVINYQCYVDLYREEFNECFECGQIPCDEGCPFQIEKESEGQTL